jgi:hypothetical protein
MVLFGSAKIAGSMWIKQKRKEVFLIAPLQGIDFQ